MIAKFKYTSIVFVFMTGFSLSGAYAFESHKISNSSHKYTFSLEGAPRMVTLRQNVLAAPFG